MNLIPTVFKNSQSRNLVFMMLLILAVPFIYNRFAIDQIEDTNGADTAIVTFSIKDYKDGDKYVGKEDAIAADGSNSINSDESKLESDYDTVYYTFELFSGMKVLQETKVSETTTFKIISTIQEGNFEVAIFKDGVYLKSIAASDSLKITFAESGVYRIVIGGESAKGSVGVQRSF